MPSTSPLDNLDDDSPEIRRVLAAFERRRRLASERLSSVAQSKTGKRAWVRKGRRVTSDMERLVSDYNDFRDQQARAAAALATTRAAILAHPDAEKVEFVAGHPSVRPVATIAADIAKADAECYNALHAATAAHFSWNWLGRLLSPRHDDQNFARRFASRNEPPAPDPTDLVKEDF